LRVVILEVEEEEVQLARAVLWFMYSGELPASPSLRTLATMLRLANLLDASRCAETVALALSRCKQEQLEVEDLNSVFQMPELLHDKECVRAALQMCKQRLVQLFGDVTALAQDDTLRSRFMRLSFPAVLAWAQEDSLRVSSDNEVLLLLHTWVVVRQFEEAEGLKQLSRAVRLMHLTPACLVSVLPDVAWFWCTRDERDAVLHRRLSSLAQDDRFMGKWNGPASWISAKPRTRTHKVTSKLLAWQVDAADLLAADSWLMSPHVYYNGFLTQACIQIHEGSKDEPGMRLRLITSTTPLAGLPGADSASHIKLRVPLSVIFKLRVRYGSPGGGAVEIDRSTYLPDGWGPTDALLRSAPTREELLRPFVHNGKMHIEFIVTDIQ